MLDANTLSEPRHRHPLRFEHLFLRADRNREPIALDSNFVDSEARGLQASRNSVNFDVPAGLRIGRGDDVSHLSVDDMGLVGATMATFAEVQRMRGGWRLNRIGRRANRAASTAWFVTVLPSDAVLAHAAARILRRGTNGQARL